MFQRLGRGTASVSPVKVSPSVVVTLTGTGGREGRRNDARRTWFAALNARVPGNEPIRIPWTGMVSGGADVSSLVIDHTSPMQLRKRTILTSRPLAPAWRTCKGCGHSRLSYCFAVCQDLEPSRPRRKATHPYCGTWLGPVKFEQVPIIILRRERQDQRAGSSSGRHLVEYGDEDIDLCAG